MRVQDWFLELCSLTEQRTRNLQSASDTTYFPLAMLIACTTEPTGGMRVFSPFSIHVRFSLDGQYGTRKFNGCPMTSKRLLCAALLLAGSSLLLATPGSAQTPPPHGHPPGHGGPPGGHGGPRFAFHHDFAHFSAGERAAWIGGRWNHAWHNGRYGWWWFAGGAWYFYDSPIYPYPGYVSDTYADDDSYGPAGQSWYYCQNPPGYYPYVHRCSMPWQPVPAAAPPAGAYGPGPGQAGGYGPGPGPGGYGPYGPGPGPGGPGPGYNGPPPGPNGGPPDDQPPPGYQGGPGPGDQPPPGYQGPGQGPGPGDQGPPGYPPGYQNQGPLPPPGPGPQDQPPPNN
jgi:hypothetical protein